MTQSIPLSELEASAAAKFENIGDKHNGTITSIKHQQQTDLDGTPKTFPSGDPMMLYVVTLQLADGDTAALWAKNGKFEVASGSGEAMLAAIGSAVRAAGASSVEVGGQLAVAFTGLGKAKPGMNQPKLYTAQYKPPTAAPASVPVDDLFSS